METVVNKYRVCVKKSDLPKDAAGGSAEVRLSLLAVILRLAGCRKELGSSQTQRHQRDNYKIK